jgi:catechol 2,3-dioxygenase-like lactoylglutathione lyase family enzyme
VARPSRDLDAARRFYTRCLDLEVLTTFVDHAGIDGVILGHPGWPYHLELTRRRDDHVTRGSTEEDLLVFYVPDRAQWSAITQRMRDLAAPAVPNANPYWNERGITVRDPDGYRIVIENAAWPGPAEPS